uniref:Uncharacterized protein n=1 Tax=uncultured marine thaumarchaeote KM3_72_A09 TaxID=1456261 RepID=A0A075HJ80_9ARCH|nr:hypothetical protein [uncultured marine thaumarchaeote KM3_72_A09]
MSFAEEEIKTAAELKPWIESKISDLESEISKLREMIVVVDSVLRRTSFRPAGDVSSAAPPPQVKTVQPTAVMPDEKETREIKRSKDGYVLATAFITSESISIVPTNETRLSPSTPPLKSFFLDRILEGMKTKDLEALSRGNLKTSQVIDYQIDEDDDVLKKITVNNYNEKSRLNEIINTASWAFTRMLEKK